MALFYLTPTQAQYLADGMGYASKPLQGAVVATSTVGAALAGLSYGRVRRRLSFRGIFAASFAVWAVGYGLTVIAPQVGLIALFAGMFVSGLGGGLLMPNSSNWLLADTPDALRGRLVGGLTSAFFAGQFVSPILAAPLVRVGGEELAFAGGAAFALALAAAFALAARRQTWTV